MHHNTRRLLPSTMIATAALTAAAALAPAATSAQSDAAEVATATSNPTAGMRYIGTSVRNNVRVTLAGTTFTVDDIVPIQPGAGCQPVTGDPTKVTCTAFKEAPSGRFRQFFADLREGDDTVVNQTSSVSSAGAAMLAIAGQGNDSLVGDDKVDDDLHGLGGIDNMHGLGGSDTLEGGSGNDDLDGGRGLDTLRGGTDRDDLRGGQNDDLLDGGQHADTIDGGDDEFGDTVSYRTRSVGVTVDLARPDLPQGQTGENDIIKDVEDMMGGDGHDTLRGDADNNDITGNQGNDHLDGGDGQDRLTGGFGRDTLIPSFNADGNIDRMDCDDLGGAGDGVNGDVAFRFLADGDFVNDCEQVLDL